MREGEVIRVWEAETARIGSRILEGRSLEKRNLEENYGRSAGPGGVCS
jgi:hypothetical protein